MNSVPRFPYHHCQASGCAEMIPHGADFCALHIPGRDAEDIYFPTLEDDFADASQQPTMQSPVPGDAGNREESHE